MHINREKLRELDQAKEQECAEEAAPDKPALIAAAEFAKDDLWKPSKLDNKEESVNHTGDHVKYGLKNFQMKSTEVKKQELPQEEPPQEEPPQETFPKEIKEEPQKTEEKETTPEIEKAKVVKKRLPGKYILLIIIGVILLAAACFKIFMDAAYKPTQSISDLIPANLNVEISDNMLVVRNPKAPEDMEKAGLIFYSALRVDGQCYLPLMIKLANLGYDCFLPVASGNQPYLNVEGADSVIRKYEDITHWVLIGHSQSCTYAATYAKNTPNPLDGLVFLGGCSDTDLSGINIPFLSLIGSKDTIVDPNKLEASKAKAPQGAKFITLQDGNNTGFTDSVLFPGDTEAGISFEEQISKTTEEIDSFVKGILQ